MSISSSTGFRCLFNHAHRASITPAHLSRLLPAPDAVDRSGKSTPSELLSALDDLDRFTSGALSEPFMLGLLAPRFGRGKLEYIHLGESLLGSVAAIGASGMNLLSDGPIMHTHIFYRERRSTGRNQ